MITLKCKSCGYVSDVDMRHKLTTFIIKNPPENKMSKEEKKCGGDAWAWAWDVCMAVLVGEYTAFICGKRFDLRKNGFPVGMAGYGNVFFTDTAIR